MTRIYILVTCLALGMAVAQAQTGQQPSIKAYLSLTGDVHFLTLFVATAEGSWEDDEKEFYYQKLLDGQQWLTEEAARYGNDVTFNNDTFADNAAEVNMPALATARMSPDALVGEIMEELFYRDLEHFFSSYNFDFKREKFKILLFVKSNNRSHAYNQWSVDDVDLAVIYCRATSGTVTNHWVVAHEILHQFGAWDLYYDTYSQTVESAALAKEMFPNSVMIDTWMRTTKEVDPLTAWRVGWADYDDSYAQFDPQYIRAIKQNGIHIDPRKTTIKINMKSGKVEKN